MSGRRSTLLAAVLFTAALAGGATRIVQDQCGPFTDVSPALCPYVAEMFYLGITAGTSATTYSPDNPVTRGQAAVFVSKGINQALARSSRRAALGQWWQPSMRMWDSGLGTTALPGDLGPFGPVVCDGPDIWVGGYDSVFRVRASDGKLLETWGIGKPAITLIATMGRILVAGFQLPTGGSGSLYVIDPSQPAGSATDVADLPSGPQGLAFDGRQIWCALVDGVAMITPSSTTPWSVTTVQSGFQSPTGIAFDGQQMWVTDAGACALLRLDNAGAVLQTVSLGSSKCNVERPTFDGANVLVPNKGTGMQVVRASDGALIATIPVSGGVPDKIVFDGDRLLVISGGASQPIPPNLTLLRASDFSTLQVEVSSPFGGTLVLDGASDGVNFWATTGIGGTPILARY